MELVHRGGGDKGEEDGIDGGRQAERAGADGIEHQVPAEVNVPDAGVGAAFDQHHTEQIHAARGAAHPEKKPDAAAAEHAADEAARELVTREDVGARDKRKKNCQYKSARNFFVSFLAENRKAINSVSNKYCLFISKLFTLHIIFQAMKKHLSQNI